MSTISVGELYDEVDAIRAAFCSFTQDLEKTQANYLKELKKRLKRPGTFVDPPMRLPKPLDIDNSKYLSTKDTNGLGSSEPQPPELTPLGSKPGHRPKRGAALKARQGVTENYKFMSQVKLRRPTNFDSTKYLSTLPTIPGTPAATKLYNGPEEPGGSDTFCIPGAAPPTSSGDVVFKVPNPPNITTSQDASESEEKIVRKSKRGRASKKKTQLVPVSDRVSRSRAPKRTANSLASTTETDECSEPSHNLHNTFKKSRMETNSDNLMNEARTGIEMESASNAVADVEFAEPVKKNSLKTRTKRKHKKESASNAASDGGDVEFAEPEPPKISLKSRDGTIKIDNEETASNTVADEPDVEFKEPDVEFKEPDPVETSCLKSRTKTIRKNKPINASAVPSNEMETESVEPMDSTGSRRRTKTIKKPQIHENRPSTTVIINDDEELVETTIPILEEETTSLRTRTRTIRKNEVDTTVTLNAGNAELLEVPKDDVRTRTKTLRKNKAAQESSKLRSSHCEGSTADITNSEVAATDVQKAKTPNAKNPKSNTKPDLSNDPPLKVSDPMDTLELPNGTEILSPPQDSNKRQHKPGTESGIPVVIRLKSGEDPIEELVESVLQNAPRTRSKMKDLAESRSRSAESRTPGTGKENSGILPVNFIFENLAGGVKHATPLAILNISPRSKSTTDSAARNKPARFVKEPVKDIEKAKLAENRRKEEEALRKKQELMEIKKLEIRKQREAKVKKVAESRAAVEKEKMKQLEKEKKEREEKEKQAKAEMIRLKEEALLKKKLLNQQKAQEAEERRQREEQLRLAKLREQEEEQRKAAEARQRQVEEAERLAALRKMQQKEEEQAKLLEKEKAKEKAKHPKVPKDVSDPDDFGIDEGDGEEQAAKPSRPVPKWAEKEARTKQLRIQTKVPLHDVRRFFNRVSRMPDLKEIFGADAFIRPRTSSAVWHTPPPPLPSP